jgi:hypothetical protein
MMPVISRRVRLAAMAALLVAAAGSAPAGQIQPWDQKFSRGQTVVPVYEGWERNPDGSATMVFGYMNRNYEQHVHAPLGPDNKFEPGPPDRGQPEHFMPRRQFFVFKVNVPKDWGDKELIWTLASNGKVEKAYGRLLPTWEIDRLIQVSNDGGAGGSDNATIDRNQPPNVVVAAVQPAAVGQPLTLTATITDDGIPKPGVRRKQAIGQETPPTLKPRGEPSPVNVPLPAVSRPPSGLSIGWSVYRGPAAVAFQPAGYVAAKDGKVVVAATFSQPGTYRLRATGTDGMLKTPTEVTVTVTGSSTR